MIKLIIGSKNPVKIEAVKEAFSKFFSDIEIEAKEISTGVAPQPINREIWDGAKNRALNLYKKYQKSEEKIFYIGIEGGLYRFPYGWFELGVTCIVTKKKDIYFGGAPFFPLPDAIVERLLGGEELSDVLDEMLSTKNIGKKEGAIGYFTKGEVVRKDLYVQSTIMALVPIIKPSLFKK